MHTFTRTLRFRLALAFSVLMVLVQGPLTFILPLVRESMAMQQSNAILAEKAFAIAAFAESAMRERKEITREDLRQILQSNYPTVSLYAQIRTGEKRILGTTKGLEETLLPFATPEESGWASDKPGSTYYTNVTLEPSSPGGGSPERSNLRMVITRLRQPNGAAAYVQVAAPIAGIDKTGTLLRWALLTAGVGSTLVAALLGWFVGAVVTNKADHVRSAVSKISAERLGERVDLPAGDDEIGQMAGEVNLMLERVAQAFLAHERFITHASHELKTPVATLLTEAQALRIGQAGEAEYRHFARSVEDEMRRLSKLVESFLLLARVGHGRRFTAEARVPINEIVIDCVQHAALLAQQTGVHIRPTLHDPGSSSGGIAVEGLVRCDGELLRVAIDNLIRNAVQISRKGDAVDVIVHCDESNAVVKVRDHGPGIPAEYLDRIFDKFAQVPRDERNRRGTGLGLTIAKGVIDLHGGRIDVANAPEGGAEFVVVLPLAEGSASRIAAVPAEPQGAGTLEGTSEARGDTSIPGMAPQPRPS
jgi:two-component system OmpR family sensor kinase